jgi:hypothetical protein
VYRVQFALYFRSVQDLMAAMLAIPPNLNPFYPGICELLEGYEQQTIKNSTSTLACFSQGQRLTSLRLRLPDRNGGQLPEELMEEDIARFFSAREVFEKNAIVRDALLSLGHVRCFSVGPITGVCQLEAIGKYLKVDELYTIGLHLRYEDNEAKGWVVHMNEEGNVEYKKDFDYS